MDMFYYRAWSMAMAIVDKCVWIFETILRRFWKRFPQDFNININNSITKIKINGIPDYYYY